MKIILLCFFFLLSGCLTIVKAAETDHLWLTYTDKNSCDAYKKYNSLILPGSKYDDVIYKELNLFFTETYDIKMKNKSNKAKIEMRYAGGPLLGKEGYRIEVDDEKILINASSDAGFLYSVYHLIRLFRTEKIKPGLDITEVPAFEIRQLNHWDDLNGNIERGYAGKSLWKWDELPEKVSDRYEEYARINASIGINAVVLNNVNADPRILRTDYLKKVAAIADVFRKYNIKVYLSANFSAPMPPSSTPDKMKSWGGIGDLNTADPMDEDVIEWWENKVAEIYSYIPDFGGFLVKANSEGMPGPHDYKRTHADGANMLANVLKPYGGIVIWRAFVYQTKNSDPDRMKRAYEEFIPMDGLFADNVILQIKNGPLDFQPSEPVSTLFGAMKRTTIMPELQITQEYMGHSTYLVYLLPMWRKFFDFDTYAEGEGSTISNVLTGRVYPQKIKAIAGVANTGSDLNWTGHYFAQSNWYAFGRLAWNPDETYDNITNDWIKLTWNADKSTSDKINKMMQSTWSNFMKSSSPYGLGITTNMIIHYHADFEFRNGKEWLANEKGVGTDRTSKGSDYVSQYNEPNRTIFNNIDMCPEDLLLAFHFVEWDYVMPSGIKFYDFFMSNLSSGLRQVDANISLWKSIKGEIDSLRYDAVLERLYKEKKDAQIFYDKAYNFFSKQYNHKK